MNAAAGSELLGSIRALWQDVLDLPADVVQPDSHFLLLGGDSLQLARLLARIQSCFGVSLPLHELTRFATPARMADCCRAEQGVARRAGETAAELPHDSRMVPATPVQQGIWLAEQLAAPRQLYLASVLVHLSGNLDPGALQAATAALFQRHSVLRARLCHDAAARSLQLQLDEPPPAVDGAMLLPQDCAAVALATRVQQAVQEPLSLDRGPLCRLRLFRLDAQHHALLLSCHHVISDGWSGGNLLAQLADGYAAALQQPELPAPAPDLRFLAYCQRVAREQQVDTRQHLQWWRHLLTGLDQAQHWLWQGHPAEPWPHHVASLTLPIPAVLVTMLRQRAQQLQHSLFTLFLYAVRAGLFACSGVTQQPLLVPVAQRRHDEEASIGCFIEPLLLPGEWQPALDLAAALQVEATGVTAARREQLPLATLTTGLHPRPLPDGNPWSSILFAFQSYPQPALHWPGLQCRVEPVAAEASQYALKLEVVPAAAEWQLRIEYASALLTPQRISALAMVILTRLHTVAGSC